MTFNLPLPNVPAEIDQDFELVKNHAPILYFDKLEPFLPIAVGYSVFKQPAASASFKRTIDFPEGCHTAIEYAIWWDWDIQHLYELEHIWVYLDVSGKLIDAEGSFHGSFHPLRGDHGAIMRENERLVAYSEPGKHAFAGSLEQITRLEPFSKLACSSNAGSGDVLINTMFKTSISATGLQKRLCKRYMKAHAFKPSYAFSQRFELNSLPLIPWEGLKAWIPLRVTAYLKQLETLPHLKAICLDCGDTLIDEGTELKDAQDYVLSAELIPGADLLLAELTTHAYRLALVADGFVKSFETIFEQHGFQPYFETKTISETLGVLKPDARMFEDALSQLAINAKDKAKIVMVGNNLNRDIKGANDFGLISVWLDWAPRRSKVAADPSEVPHFTIKEPLELLDVLESIEIDFFRQHLNLTDPRPLGVRN